jgi:hypothetical protein
MANPAITAGLLSSKPSRFTPGGEEGKAGRIPYVRVRVSLWNESSSPFGFRRKFSDMTFCKCPN